MKVFVFKHSNHEIVERKTIAIRQVKGRKDHLTILSETAMTVVLEYVK